MIINDDEDVKKCHNACLSKQNQRPARCSQRNDNATFAPFYLVISIIYRKV
jgi:hypothetical protein